MTKATPSGTRRMNRVKPGFADVDVGQSLLGHRDHVAGALRPSFGV